MRLRVGQVFGRLGRPPGRPGPRARRSPARPTSLAVDPAADLELGAIAAALEQITAPPAVDQAEGLELGAITAAAATSAAAELPATSAAAELASGRPGRTSAAAARRSVNTGTRRSDRQ